VQLRHTDAPLPLYVPAPHSVWFGVVEPAAHTYPALQLVQDVAPAELKRPAGQSPDAGATLVHGVAAHEHTYPASHILHAVAPPLEYFPSLHRVGVV
jgi:hypothetical protein